MVSLPLPGTLTPDSTLPSNGGVDVSRSYGTVIIDPNRIVPCAFPEETPGTRRQHDEHLAYLEAHRLSA